MLAVLGGAAGLLLAIWGVPVLAGLAPQDIEQARAATIDAQVMMFALGISLLTALLFGLVPALQATKPNLNESLKAGGTGLSANSGGRMRSLLVVSEIALAMVLLIGGGLLLRSFARLSNVNPGYRTSQLLTLEVFPSYGKYNDTTKRAAFYDELLQRVQALPGVEAAAVVTALPAKSNLLEMTWITEQRERPKVISAVPLSASAGYFQTLAMPLVAGRTFDQRDLPNTDGVIVINEAMAKAAWPADNPLGKRMKMGVMTNPWLTVVGVIKNTRLRLEMTPAPQVYLSYAQTPAFGPGDLVLQTKSEPTSLAAAVRREVWVIDKDQPVAEIRTMESLLDESIERPRFNTLLIAIFGSLAMLLAVIGIFGVMSYTVTQNRRDIGLRMALGAQASDVLKLVIKQGMSLVLVGITLGVLAALTLTKVMTTLLFDVTATDPLTFAGMAVLFVAVAFLACYLPARRANCINPLEVMRND
ncbi:MAG: FtsX-like permease family protein [Blastocatellia bacterium]